MNMNLMFQAKVSKSTARKFIDYMTRCGFKVQKENEHYSFWRGNEINQDYSVYISEFDRQAFIGTRAPSQKRSG